LHKLTADIAFMFADRPFLDRIDAAKAAGFRYVECQWGHAAVPGRERDFNAHFDMARCRCRTVMPRFSRNAQI
jgi:hydroxypyruvate isomerase